MRQVVHFSWLAILVAGVSCAQKPVPEEDPAPDRNWVEPVARDHNHEVLKCYEDRLKNNPKLRGDLTLSLDAGANGDVTAVRVTKSLDAVVDRCVTGKAQTWKFPWLKKATTEIEDAYHLYLSKDGQPISEYESPNDAHAGARQIVREHLVEVRTCYESRLKEKPNLSGKLIVDWNLSEKGEVTGVNARQPLDYIVDHCVMDQVKNWKFPPPPRDKKVSISYPFFFAPR